jgi:hypothetical protein
MSDQSNSAAASRHSAVEIAMPASRRPLVSVCMDSRSPTHSRWCSVAARVTPPTSRWPSGCRSERPSTIAAAPEPRVRVANCASTSSREASGRASRSRVTSWVWRAPSPSTISAWSIWPASIMTAASWIPLRKPRQALARSKLRQDVGRPSAACTAAAADGSRWARLTEVSISRPTSDGSTPASANALAPAIAAASEKLTSCGHHRRSTIPASPSSSPGRRPTRW